MNPESAGPRSPPHRTGPAAQAPVDPKVNEDSDAAATAAKDAKPPKEPGKTQSAQREPVPTTEPMRTRRAQYAEGRKLSGTAQAGPTPTAKRPQAEEPTEKASAGALPEKEFKEEVKQEETKLPQLPVKTSRSLSASLEVIEDQPQVSVVKPAEDSEPLKRKSLGGIGDELTPEKRPRLTSVSSLSSVSSVSPPATSLSSPATPTSATNHRIPPLKVGNM